MSRLVWARQSKRHAAHLTWQYFADPAHGSFPNPGDEPRRIGACEADFPVTQFLDQPNNDGWKFCQSCMAALGEAIEQTMPGGT